ncbi:unnamed protein product [Penicillium discolor]
MIDRLDYFAARLAFETDPSDGRVSGALHMPHSEIAHRAPEEIPADAEVVVYCWSPGCNGGVRGALEFARLGYRVREMIGGFEYWAREGYPIEDAEGVHHRPVDPLTGIPRIRTHV